MEMFQKQKCTKEKKNISQSWLCYHVPIIEKGRDKKRTRIRKERWKEEEIERDNKPENEKKKKEKRMFEIKTNKQEN